MVRARKSRVLAHTSRARARGDVGAPFGKLTRHDIREMTRMVDAFVNRDIERTTHDAAYIAVQLHSRMEVAEFKFNERSIMALQDLLKFAYKSVRLCYALRCARLCPCITEHDRRGVYQYWYSAALRGVYARVRNWRARTQGYIGRWGTRARRSSATASTSTQYTNRLPGGARVHTGRAAFAGVSLTTLNRVSQAVYYGFS